MEKIYDVIIVGGGPAGLTAALYLTRARYSVLVFEKDDFGGQITITDEVVNYPGIERTDGKKLTGTIYRQAENFGTEFMRAEVTGFELNDKVKTVHTEKGDFRCFGILLAMGAHPRIIGFKGEKEFRGRGVAYCATCDGEFFTGKEIFVIGGGFAAAEESVFLTKYASHVTILIREEGFTCARGVAEHAENHPDISVITCTEVEEIKGKDGPDYIRYKNVETGEVTEYNAPDGQSFGVFVFAGYEPETGIVKEHIRLDEQGYVITDDDMKTSAEGVYAAGDICVKSLRQVVTATGDGAMAASALEKYVSQCRDETGINTLKPEKKEKGLFDGDMLKQLSDLFDRMEKTLIMKLYPDDGKISSELEKYIYELAENTDKLRVEKSAEELDDRPCVRIYDGNSYTGIAFHGVPGGHEFTSFVLGIYNAGGPGQAIDENIRSRISRISKKTDIKIMVSLSCTMCPELVTAAWRMASLCKNITADVYDIRCFDKYREKYKIMSVPCMIINDKHVYFGRKNIQQLLETVEEINQ